MNLINNLMPSNVNEKDFEKIISKNKLYGEELHTWQINDKVYAKIYFERVYVSNSSIIKSEYKSVICKSKDYHFFRRETESNYEYILEFYIDRDFEFNSVWEGIYTTI